MGHVVDSLSALPLLRERGIERFVDLGSGGGYPGLPLAIALPAARALLAEPIRKKAAFLHTVIEAVGAPGIAEAAAVRVETLAADPRHRGRWPAVTARAVAGLAELVELAFPLLAAGRDPHRLEARRSRRRAGCRRPGRRRAGRRPASTIYPVRVPGLEGHALVVATTRGRVPAAYPRDPGARKRRPW